jgi:predicted glutamine amidotransferase
MCKVFAMTNTKQFKVNRKFIQTVRNEVCRHADQDGFGYAVLSTKGDIGGERTIRPLNFLPLIDPQAPKVAGNLPIALKANNGFGMIDLANAKAFIGHGRLATNAICLENTHPFTNGEVALIHNGVVNDPTSTLKNLTSTCDTEILLRYWEKGGVEEIEKMVSGYYAVAILDKEGMLHIMRDDRADLFISWCKTVDSFIIATTADIIKNVAKEMKWKIEHPEEILEKTYTVFSSNDIVKHLSIIPRSSTYSSGYDSNYNYNRGGYNSGAGYNSYNGGKKTTETIGGASSETSFSTPSTKTAINEEGAWDTSDELNNGYSEADAASEPVPKHKELPGRVASGSSGDTTETTSSDTTDQTGVAHSSLASALLEDIVDGSGDPDLDQRVELIVSEVEDWRERRRSASDI